MHGAHKPSDCVGFEPAAAGVEEQGLGWKNSCGKGHSEDTTTSGLEGAWTQAPTQWTTLYLQNLLNLDWQETRSPAGAIQWIPNDEAMHNTVPDAHVEGKLNAPVMIWPRWDGVPKPELWEDIAAGRVDMPSAHQAHPAAELHRSATV